MRLKVFSSVLTILILLAGSGAAVFANDNLLKNGGFEEVVDGTPVGWTTETWIKDDGLTEFSVDHSASFEGGSSAVIHNIGENHSRWLQTVKVKSNKIYRISGYVKTGNIAEVGIGAHLFVEGVAVHYPEIRESDTDWTYIEFYGKTGSKQKEITVGASLGGYGQINAGTGWFDDLAVAEVGKAPEGAEVFPLTPTLAGGDAGHDDAKKVSIVTILGCALLFVILYAFLYRRLLRGNHLLQKHAGIMPALLFGSFALALALRVVIAMFGAGYASDMALFMHWSNHAVQAGISGFYSGDVFVDYPPGYIYVLYALGHVKEWLSIGSGTSAAWLLFKLPAILADLAIAAVVWQLAKRKLNDAMALGLTLLILFNPTLLVDSAAWGQVDSVFTLALLLSISGIAEKRFARASVWYAIAALIKPQAFIFMPVLLLALILNRKWKDWLISAYYGFATFILLALPFFWGNGGLKGIYDLYKGTLSSYPYTTLNAFNLYTLVSGNWHPIENKWLFMSYSGWGLLFILATVAFAAYYAFAGRKHGGEDRSFFLAALIIAVVFIGVTKMHERYIFPAVLLSLLAFVQMRDRRMLQVFWGFTLTSFINIAYVLDHSSFTTNVPADGIAIFCALANIGLLLYMLYIGYDKYVRNRSVAIEELTPDDKLRADEAELAGYRMENAIGQTGSSMDVRGHKLGRDRLSRKDWLWMGGITAVYAIIALYSLGSFKAPETVWQPASSAQSFYVDLGETKQLERINSFGGVGTGKFKLEFAVTPREWGDAHEVDSNHVAVFAWRSQHIDIEARYVKLSVTQTGFSIHELAIFEKGSKTPLPIAEVVNDSSSAPKRGSVEHLFDEQHLVIYDHSFMKGSYFDEIYHARTAYENLEGIVAYENTHPPLGKLFIALGMQLFGLGPFGWRIAGTLFGIGMIPIIYLTGRHMFRSTTYAAMAAALLAADFMHFSQTRISTIDVYGVFFIMIMFYFMNKYSSMNFYRNKLLVTWVPLGLAGLMFGLGVASKWIVLYGGAGLAIMLALSLFDRYKEYAAAKRMLRADDVGKRYDIAQLARIVKVFPLYTLLTLAVCLVFYIAIPAGIYALSYIPILSVMNGGYTLKALIDYQINMFSYHSNLVSSHPFSSSWWEWPFMKRPVWYYNGGGLAEGMKSTIAAFGNPLIWWTGIFAMLLTIYISVKRKERHIYMLWIAYLSQYVPWMLVTRETFLYHYFAMVPFFILSIAYVFKYAEENMSWAWTVKARTGYIIAAVLLFALFYPVLSGMLVPDWYVTMLRWFPSWVF